MPSLFTACCPGLLRLILCLVFLAGLPVAVSARFYKYVDDSGTIVFVEDKSRIPQKYWSQLKTYDEASDRLSPDERKAAAERRQSEQTDAAALNSLTQSLETSVTIRNNRVLVPVSVRYDTREVTVRLVLDTGATNTVFYDNAIMNLGVPVDAGKVGYGQVVGGHKIQHQMVQFRTISVGPYEIRNPQASIIKNIDPDADHDGLLGMDFLQQMKYRIDFDRQVIRWLPESESR
ncbi:MAG: hypothetical protein A2091_03265 [Desulfuromonadales bacterium GWD2_61_12]|nr:MAG: hypothetical protein A2005_09420 [Desulfuromonadales bacterium GWC2_61_20]OGR36138.1 MAG: hypothetical protein A2091_03265 [Desulfuromonadales bacterium GWD2_61_12]